jgi:hypothetical protein
MTVVAVQGPRGPTPCTFIHSFILEREDSLAHSRPNTYITSVHGFRIITDVNSVLGFIHRVVVGDVVDVFDVRSRIALTLDNLLLW